VLIFYFLAFSDMAQNEFALAIKQIASERGIEVEDVVEAIKEGVKMGFEEYRKNDEDLEEDTGVGVMEALEVDIDMEAGTIAAYADKKVVQEVTHPATQISLKDAQKLESKLKLGDHVLVEITQSGDFGRIAAQAARQVIMQFVRDAEREAVLKQFEDKLLTIDTAIVQRMDREGNVLFEINRATAKMPPQEQIPSEFYRSAERYKVLLKKIQKDSRGKILIVSRADNDFLRALFEMEVPEISSGTVEIMAIAREPGSRSKVAVKSNSEGVDAIGACVGQRGARINAITNELKNNSGEEKIDIIPWNDDIQTFLGNSIRPAQAVEVKIIDREDKQALIIVSEDDQSLAIGREGQNVRLAAKLTGWRLDIQGQDTYKNNKGKSKFEMSPDEKAAAKSGKADAKESDAGEIAQLDLGARIEKSLAAAGIDSLEALRAKIESGEAIEGVGEKSVDKIKEALS
jgi:N utilization substance protein A